MRRAGLLIFSLLLACFVLGAHRANAQSLAGTWSISNSAPNSCPGKLQINSAGASSGEYTGIATFQCGSDPAVTESFDIAVAHGIVTMRGHNASGPWCADSYTLNLLSDSAMTGSSKDGCGATGTVFLSKAQ
ncbi:MAG TPA: hypothetical protein VMU81_21005 [Acetobacteraceae bacterium]|nr:hypothetical protein [Acetobacteraceae bacterium]